MSKVSLYMGESLMGESLNSAIRLFPSEGLQ